MYLFQDDLLIKNNLPNKNLNVEISVLEDVQVLLLHAEEILDSHKDLINNMMKACKINASNFQVLNCANTFYNLNSLLSKENNLNTIILFGIETYSLGFNIKIPYNLPYKFSNKYWIKTHALSELNDSNALKNQLWTGAFKPHFVDK